MANLMRKRNRAKYVEQRERKIKRKRLSKLMDEKVKGKKILKVRFITCSTSVGKTRGIENR